MTEVLDQIGEELMRAARARSERAAKRRPWQTQTGAGFASTRRRLIALAITFCAAVVAFVLATGGSPSGVAQAFPILAANATVFGVTPLHSRGSVAIAQAIVQDVRTRAHYHPFPPPYTGRGYVVESANGRTLGVYYVTTNPTGIGFSGAEVTTSQAERHGFFYSASGRGSSDLFIALVPTGGTLDATYRGQTRSLAVRGGVATGVEAGGTVLTIRVGSNTLTRHLRPYGK
jgi:hypothetical protein